jgi:hypothetical protein
LKGMKDLMSRTSRGLVRVRAFRRWTPRRGQSGHRRTVPGRVCGLCQPCDDGEELS